MHIPSLPSLFRARAVYYFVLARHLCYPKGSSGPVNVSVVLALIMEWGTESMRRNKDGTDSTCLWDEEWTRVEKREKKQNRKVMVENSFRTAWMVLFAQCHTGTDKSHCMATQQQSLSTKERWHLVWWKNTDLTPLGLSLLTGLFKLQDTSYLLASGIKKTLKLATPYAHIFIIFPHSISKTLS